jgi:conjugal transfer pilus assembly protein TraU
MSAWLRALIVLLAACAAAPAAAATCNGKLFNPITDICWSCAFPLSLLGRNIIPLSQEDNGSSQGIAPVCACTGNGVPRVGVTMGFWEPARLVEVVREPFCFPQLAGAKLDAGIRAPEHGRNREDNTNVKSFYHVHWYMNPLMYWLEVLLDNTCLERGQFDLAYLTELDPFWEDSEASFILNPDAALYSNVVAQAACAADCVSATAGFPSNTLYWCAGCQGPMFPLTGHVGAHVGGVQASALLVQRMTHKLHRELLMWAAVGADGRCGFYPQPVMDKRNYKMQMVYPVPNTKKIAGRCCQPFGRTSALWGSGKEFPYKGEDFAYQIFRKRDCCAGASVLSFPQAIP